MPLYFSYGSNMDRGAMAVRCPRSTPMGLARLPRHRPALTRRGLATVVRDPRRTVWGVLWNLALADIPALDRWEEIGAGLYVKTQIPVIRDGGAAVRSLIYIARNDPSGAPAGSAYGAGIIAAAREAGVPAPYLASLALLFRGEMRGRAS